MLRQKPAPSLKVCDDLPVMVILLDPGSFLITYINHIVLKILGGTPSDFIDHDICEFCETVYKNDVRKHLTTLQSHGKTIISDIVVKGQNGIGVDVVMKSQYSEGKIFIVLHNISNYKKYERLNKILESRVRQRTATLHEQLDYITQQNRQLNDFKSALLNVMGDLKQEQRNFSEVNRLVQELRRSNEELEQYASLASHDLKAPLRMVVSHLQILGKKMGERLKAEEKVFLDFAVDGAKRMDRMLSGILEYSRISSEKKPFEWVDMNEVIKEALNNLHAVINETDARVEFSQLPPLVGDHLQLVQLMQNLIGNGIKFKNIYPPQISIFSEKTPTHILFMVRDNGIGIEEHSISKIFRIFEQVNRDGKYPGNGLGLAICKGIVQRHGGKIWAESHPGTGTTFFFTLERYPEGQPIPVPPKFTDFRVDGGSNSHS